MSLLQNPDSTDVQDLQTVTKMLPDIEDALLKGAEGEGGEVGLNLEELDKACENVALMIQYIESYEGFVRHCCEEVERAREYREKETGKVRMVGTIGLCSRARYDSFAQTFCL